MKKLGILALGATALSAMALTPLNSGLNVGEMVSAFHPTHVTGPHKGTDACPPCTYGNLPQVQVWVNGDSPENVAAIAKTLNEAVVANKASKLRGFVIVLTGPGSTKETISSIEGINRKLGSNDISMAYLSTDNNAVKAYKVNTANEVKNTIFVYRDKTVKSKFVNIEANKKGLADLSAAVSGITK